MPRPSPQVEVLLAEVVGGDTLRLFIDHPDGVTLELCERVTARSSAPCASATRSRSPRPAPSARSPSPPTSAASSAAAPASARATRATATQLHRRARRRLATSEVTIAADDRRDRHPVRRHPPFEPRRGVSSMSREIVEAMHALAREKGIAADKLIAALEDALLSAYKKQPGSAKYARVELDPETGDYRVIELIVPERLEAQLIVETIDEGTYLDPETGESVEPQDPEIDPAKFERVPRPDRRARRHARRLRPHRRADRQAGDPPADPRGRARHDVRGVPRPRRRADHRHRPAVRLALHARAAARARRGAAAEVRAGRRRALRPLAAHQGRHQGGLALHEGPVDHRLAAATRS